MMDDNTARCERRRVEAKLVALEEQEKRVARARELLRDRATVDDDHYALNDAINSSTATLTKMQSDFELEVAAARRQRDLSRRTLLERPLSADMKVTPRSDAFDKRVHAINPSLPIPNDPRRPRIEAAIKEERTNALIAVGEEPPKDDPYAPENATSRKDALALEAAYDWIAPDSIEEVRAEFDRVRTLNQGRRGPGRKYSFFEAPPTTSTVDNPPVRMRRPQSAGISATVPTVLLNCDESVEQLQNPIGRPPLDVKKWKTAELEKLGMADLAKVPPPPTAARLREDMAQKLYRCEILEDSIGRQVQALRRPSTAAAPTRKTNESVREAEIARLRQSRPQTASHAVREMTTQELENRLESHGLLRKPNEGDARGFGVEAESSADRFGFGFGPDIADVAKSEGGQMSSRTVAFVDEEESEFAPSTRPATADTSAPPTVRLGRAARNDNRPPLSSPFRRVNVADDIGLAQPHRDRLAPLILRPVSANAERRLEDLELATFGTEKHQALSPVANLDLPPRSLPRAAAINAIRESEVTRRREARAKSLRVFGNENDAPNDFQMEVIGKRRARLRAYAIALHCRLDELQAQVEEGLPPESEIQTLVGRQNRNRRRRRRRPPPKVRGSVTVLAPSDPSRRTSNLTATGSHSMVGSRKSSRAMQTPKSSSILRTMNASISPSAHSHISPTAATAAAVLREKDLSSVSSLRERELSSMASSLREKEHSTASMRDGKRDSLREKRDSTASLRDKESSRSAAVNENNEEGPAAVQTESPGSSAPNEMASDLPPPLDSSTANDDNQMIPTVPISPATAMESSHGSSSQLEASNRSSMPLQIDPLAQSVAPDDDDEGDFDDEEQEMYDEEEAIPMEKAKCVLVLIEAFSDDIEAEDLTRSALSEDDIDQMAELVEDKAPKFGGLLHYVTDTGVALVSFGVVQVGKAPMRNPSASAIRFRNAAASALQLKSGWRCFTALWDGEVEFPVLSPEGEAPTLHSPKLLEAFAILDFARLHGTHTASAPIAYGQQGMYKVQQIDLARIHLPPDSDTTLLAHELAGSRLDRFAAKSSPRGETQSARDRNVITTKVFELGLSKLSESTAAAMDEWMYMLDETEGSTETFEKVFKRGAEGKFEEALKLLATIPKKPDTAMTLKLIREHLEACRDGGMSGYYREWGKEDENKKETSEERTEEAEDEDEGNEEAAEAASEPQKPEAEETAGGSSPKAQETPSADADSEEKQTAGSPASELSGAVEPSQPEKLVKSPSTVSSKEGEAEPQSPLSRHSSTRSTASSASSKKGRRPSSSTDGGGSAVVSQQSSKSVSPMATHASQDVPPKDQPNSDPLGSARSSVKGDGHRSNSQPPSTASTPRKGAPPRHPASNASSSVPNTPMSLGRLPPHRSPKAINQPGMLNLFSPGAASIVPPSENEYEEAEVEKPTLDERTRELKHASALLDDQWRVLQRDVIEPLRYETLPDLHQILLPLEDGSEWAALLGEVGLAVTTDEMAKDGAVLNRTLTREAEKFSILEESARTIQRRARMLFARRTLQRLRVERAAEEMLLEETRAAETIQRQWKLWKLTHGRDNRVNDDEPVFAPMEQEAGMRTELPPTADGDDSEEEGDFP